MNNENAGGEGINYGSSGLISPCCLQMIILEAFL